VADDHRAAGEFEQRFFQRAQGFDVEVVAGLVEHQHVAALGQGLGQVQPAALAARQAADLLLLVIALEVEAAQIGAAGHHELADDDVVQPARHVLPNRLFILQALAALVDEGQLRRLADLDFAAVGLLLALDHAEQRRLAGAVGADDADDGARGHLEAELVDQQPVAEALADGVEFEHLVAQAFGHRDEDFVGLVALLVFDVAQFLEARQPRLALGLACLGVGAHPFEFLLHRLHARVFALLLDFEALFLLVQPVGVVALPRDAGAAVEFEDPFGGVVEEVAVVGDGDHGARKALQEMFEPLDRLGVEVVGGLVEQQHVGLAQQQPAQRDAALFAARQHPDLRLPGRQAQRVGGQLQLQVGVLAAGGGDHGFQIGLLGGQLVEVGVFVAVFGIDLVQPLLGRQHAAHAFFHHLAHGLVRRQQRLLRQVADVQARHRGGFALDLLVQAGHDLEQRALARAVDAEHADLGAGEEGQVDVLQDLPLRRHDLADAVHGEDVLGHGSGLGCWKVGGRAGMRRATRYCRCSGRADAAGGLAAACNAAARVLVRR